MKTFNLINEPKIAAGFKTPDNYFENFSAKLTQKLQESTTEETKVIPLFRKRKNILMAVAAILVLALMTPIVYQENTKNKELDEATLENYLAEQTNLNQEELIRGIDPKNSKIIADTKDLETQVLEDILASNPNLENLLIEN